MKAIFPHFHSFRRCRSGATAIEFALVAPVMFLLLMGIIEFGLIFFTTAVLEGSTSIGSRTGKTGYYTGSNREQFIRQQIQTQTGGLIDVSKLQISMLSYNAFENIGQQEPCFIAVCTIATVNPPPPQPPVFDDVNGNGHWDPDQGAAGPGGSSQVVLYQVSYPWKIFTPLMRQFLGNAQGIYTIQTVATVRNENFP